LVFGTFEEENGAYLVESASLQFYQKMVFGKIGKAAVYRTIRIVFLPYLVQELVEFVPDLKAVRNQVLVVHFFGDEIQKDSFGPGQSHQQRQGIEIPLGKSRFYRNRSESQKL